MKDFITKFIFLSAFFSFCYSYEKDFYDYSQTIQERDAVAVIASNRPHYLRQLIQSIEKTQESQTLPFFFFLDFVTDQSMKENIQLIQNAAIAHKNIISRPFNYGCPKNHIDAKRFLFDWCHFDRIVVIEEDVILSQDYFRLLFDLYDWANDHYSNIGTVQLWTHCMMSLEEKQRNLQFVREVRPLWSMVTYCIGKNVWDVISSDLFRYESFIDPLLKKPEYQIARSKPAKGPTADACKAWIYKRATELKKQNRLAKFGTEKPVWVSSWKEADWERLFAISQDKTNSFLLWLHGYTRVETVVNRVAHIGKIGISGTWDKNIVLDEFAEDRNPLPFIPLNY